MPGVFRCNPGAAQPNAPTAYCSGLAATASSDDVTRRVGAGERFPWEVELANRGTSDHERLRLRLVVPRGWKAEPDEASIALLPANASP